MINYCPDDFDDEEEYEDPDERRVAVMDQQNDWELEEEQLEEIRRIKHEK